MESRARSNLDWRIRLCTAVGVGAGAAIALFVVRPLVGELPFWPGLMAFIGVTLVGGAMGRFVGMRLARPAEAS